jgi:DNA replication protein DnaC
MKKLTRQETDELLEQYVSLGQEAKRGVGLLGNTGVGKSVRAQKLTHNLISAYDLSLARMDNKIGQLITKFKQEIRIGIDDIGSEGNYNVDLVSQLIQCRYDLWKKSKTFKFYFTTNLTPEMISERYPGIMQRLQEMCTLVILSDSDIRQEETVDEL